MFNSLLIANRGEIACRIIRTARRMGLRTIAVYSDADRDALHVRIADSAVHIGPAPASESYLRTDRILDAAHKSGAQAIHPGYGFLSERIELAQGCADHGMIWVGPHVDAIRAMGSKIEAKRIAEAAGVPCIQGYAGANQTDAALVNAARDIGLPVMVKASAGGGGKGMRAVFDDNALASAITSARQEAERSFGDGRLLIEKLVQNPRHIEVQLLGDKHGSLLHLFERDCSVQRNHQKLIEEAPAPCLREDTRAALYDAALKLGRQIGYDSTGTVEFIMDATTEAFSFLEMNTRLQVEHTVTEEITGIDLVEQQLRVAAGEPLAFAQNQITCSGHAIEARLTAEDASDGFRPETGAVLHWKPEPAVRCDSGITAGSVIGASYDSMIAKLIAHGADRAEASQKLAMALERLEMAGPMTTRLFLRDALRSDRFNIGTVTTDFLAREWPDGWQPAVHDTLAIAALARHTAPRPAASPWHTQQGFRLLQGAGHGAQTNYIEVNGPNRRVTLANTVGGFQVTTAQGDSAVSVSWPEPNRMMLWRDGVKDSVGVLIDGDLVHLTSHDFDAVHQIVPLGDFSITAAAQSVISSDKITAAMPGLIVEMRVQPGDRVTTGDTLVVMESMKLLMDLKANSDGLVSTVNATEGDTVEAGALLVQLKHPTEED